MTEKKDAYIKKLVQSNIDQQNKIALLSAKVYKLQKENAELKAKNKWYSEQVCNKECAEVWGQLTKATEIIKKLKALYFSPVVTKDDVKRQGEILAEAEQFLKSEVDK